MPRHQQLTLPYFDAQQTTLLTDEDQIASIEPSLESGYANVAQAAVISHLTGKLMRSLGKTAIVRVRTPIDLGAIIVPDPSLVICENRRDRYKSSHPLPSDISLVIEVLGDLESGDHVRFDVYRDYGISTVWAIDVENQILMVQDNRLMVNAIYQESERVTVPGTNITFTVSELLNV